MIPIVGLRCDLPVSWSISDRTANSHAPSRLIDLEKPLYLLEIAMEPVLSCCNCRRKEMPRLKSRLTRGHDGLV